MTNDAHLLGPSWEEVPVEALAIGDVVSVGDSIHVVIGHTTCGDKVVENGDGRVGVLEGAEALRLRAGWSQ